MLHSETICEFRSLYQDSFKLLSTTFPVLTGDTDRLSPDRSAASDLP